MSVLTAIDSIDYADNGLKALMQMADGIKGDHGGAIAFVTIAVQEELAKAKADLEALKSAR